MTHSRATIAQQYKQKIKKKLKAGETIKPVTSTKNRH